MGYNADNLFAKVIRKELPSEIVYEDEYVLAIKDIHPSAPVHILVMPKGEYVSFDDFVQKATEHEIALFFIKVQQIAKQYQVDVDGYRLVANHGKNGGQAIPHFHVHILGKRPLGAIAAGDEYHA
jgi:histidine triad (HIT) family protein